LIEELKFYYPTIINSYKRKYFVSSDKKYRITIDWDQYFFRIGSLNNFFKEKVRDQMTCILEIKYSLEDEKSVSLITQHFPFRLIANSKYVKGIDALDFCWL